MRQRAVQMFSIGQLWSPENRSLKVLHYLVEFWIRERNLAIASRHTCKQLSEKKTKLQNCMTLTWNTNMPKQRKSKNFNVRIDRKDWSTCRSSITNCTSDSKENVLPDAILRCFSKTEINVTKICLCRVFKFSLLENSTMGLFWSKDTA